MLGGKVVTSGTFLSSKLATSTTRYVAPRSRWKGRGRCLRQGPHRPGVALEGCRNVAHLVRHQCRDVDRSA